MRGLHLTLALFCQLLLASVVIYFTSLSAASPLFSEPASVAAASKDAAPKDAAAKPFEAPPAVEAVKSPALVATPEHKSAAQPAKPAAGLEARSSVAPAATTPTKVAQAPAVEPVKPQAAKAAPISEEKTMVAIEPAAAAKSVAPSPASGKQEVSAKSGAESILTKKDSDTVQPSHAEQKKPRKDMEPIAAPTSPLDTQQAAKPQPEVRFDKLPAVVPQPAALVAEPTKVVEAAPAAVVQPVAQKQPQQQQQQQQSAPAPQQSVVVKEAEPSAKVESAPAKPVQAAPAPAPASAAAHSPAVVMGGLGPLHLLATTLCSYQPDKSVADENLNQLYARRASVRKSLFDFMSLKFTNLEKLSSRLGSGLQVVPAVAKSPAEESKGLMPSHGWPVVGKCTAYDLKLMGEAAWCECQASDNCNEFKPAQAVAGTDSKASTSPASTAAVDEDEKPAAITSNRHVSAMKAARSLAAPDTTYSLLPTPEESSVISKILHVTDVKDAPLVESSIYNLNLTQHQLATLEAHATSTQECRRNALRYSKALFNHLAEDQRAVSESWPKLYAAVSADDCARKRVIDIMNALSGFRTDTTSIRRDNLEFAFAMDDLRAKVLENEVNVPLTFDRHFIEVEQFLQQSVRLMLANIQPKRAQLTSMRYRSLMYGAASDEQCVDLHQRLLARNYPSDCNPTQFGQLPDVLRMTAGSLELWSIEKELSMRMAKVADYPNESPAGQQKVKADVNECIANLVSS